MKRKISATLITVGASLLTAAPAWAECPEGQVETAILGNGGCWDGEVVDLLNLIVDIMTVAIGILGVIGIVVVGIQYLTARDNSGQVQKAKTRLMQIVIGLAVYAAIYAIVTFLMPS